MSHTPILVFGLRPRPLFPLGGGNGAALQHEGRVGSERPGRSFRPEGRCSRAPLSSHYPSSPGVDRRAAREAARWSRRPAGQSALPLPRGGRPRRGHGGPGLARAGAAVTGVLRARRGGRQGRGQQPSRDSRAPGGRPRDQGGDPAPQAGAHRARRDPGEARGSRPAGSWSLDSRLRLSTQAVSPQGRPREGRISGSAAAAPGGLGGGGGRLARRLGQRPRGPGLGPPQPPPRAAGAASSGCARRGRKLSDLASAGRHSDSD